MSREPAFTRRAAIAGAVGISLAVTRTWAQPRRLPSLVDFGGVGDGRADNAAALRSALAATGAGKVLHVPAGSFLVSDRSIYGGEPGFALPPGFTLSGDGARSRLLFQRERFPSFYGLTIKNNGIHVRDLALEVDTAGSGWTAAVGIVGATRDLRFTNVSFLGTRRRAGHYGIFPINADLDGLTVSGGRFERLDFGMMRQTSDTSDHRRLAFTDCIGEDCTAVFEINAPGLGFIATRAGSDVLERFDDPDGTPLDPERLRVGQAIRSSAFPAGTVVAGRDRAGRVRASRPALSTTPRGRPARLSSGSASGGEIRNLVARNIGQWAVGLANCDNWQVEVQGQEIGYELVHIEDGSRDISISAGGSRCNLMPGVVGSPAADNGMVHISTGSRDISVHLATADLTQNPDGKTAGLCVQPGGPMGTTGREVAPTGITVSGRVLLREGTRGVVAYESELAFDGLELINPNPGSRADPMMRLPGCVISGNVRVRNPGRALIQEEPNRPRGSLSRVEQI